MKNLKPLKRGKSTLYPACKIDKKKKLLAIKEFVDTAISLAEVEDWKELDELKFNVELALEAFNNPENIIDGIVYATHTKCSVIKNLVYGYIINI